MKKHIQSSGLLFFISLFILSLSGCKDKDEDIVRIQSVVPQDIIDALVSKGMIINEGINPPTINGAISVSPFELKSPFGPADPWQKGKIISDYYYNFYGQTDKNEIRYDYYNDASSDEGEGAGAFIAGDGNEFTIFSEDKGVSKDIPYKLVTIISGELSQNGIKNFQYAFVIKEKTGDDDNSVLIAVGAARVWFDGDNLSETIDDFRLSAEEIQLKVKNPKSALSAK